MRLSVKFAIAVIIVLVSTMGLMALLVIRHQSHAVQQEALLRSRTLLSMAQAVRSYTRETLSPAIREAVKGHKGPLVFEGDSATVVVKGTFSLFSKIQPGYTLREAALNPLARSNLADDEETALIEGFRADTSVKEKSGFRVKDGHDIYYVARPILVEQACLKCHGTPDKAPPELVARYGSESGFGWAPGAVQGVLLVTVPMDDIRAEQRAVMWTALLGFGGAALLVVGVLFLLFEWLVHRRLRKLAGSMAQLAGDPVSHSRLPEAGGDELARLSHVFNGMASSVAEAHHTLEARVRERTTMLQEANSALADEVRERRRAEESARQALLAADAANKAKSEFLASMSHEVRTPLHGILGLADLALETDLTAEQREYLSMVKSSGQALATIVNDILDFSKIEAGKLDLDPLPFSSRDAIGEALKILAVRAHARGLELSFEADPGLPEWLSGDATRLRQVVNNLVGNAIKFTERGEVAVRASVEDAAADAVTLRVEVRDTGIGVPAEKLARIFEPFEQADHTTTRKYGGTGLGLTIAARLVELMGGRVGVSSEPGKGSTFWFTVRLGRVQGSVQQLPALPAGKRVRLLGPEGTTLGILERLLPRWGLVPVREGPCDAAIADGEAALEGAGLAGVPVLVLCPAHRTAVLRPDMRRLIKPAREAELRDALSKMLAGGAGAGPAPAAPPPGPRPLRVLVAEDGAINQRLIERLLDKRGHSVKMVADGAAAVEAVKAEPFDLVLMDVHMPVMDGLDATRLIREWEAGRPGGRLPVLALTASAMEADRQRCMSAGMDAFLSKPLRLEHLDELLAAVAEGRTPGAA